MGGRGWLHFLTLVWILYHDPAYASDASRERREVTAKLTNGFLKPALLLDGHLPPHNSSLAIGAPRHAPRPAVSACAIADEVAL